MTREEHYRAALERIAGAELSQTDEIDMREWARETLLAAGGALPAEDTDVVALARLNDQKWRAAEARLEQIRDLLLEAQRETWHGLTANPDWINRKITEALSLAGGEASGE